MHEPSGQSAVYGCQHRPEWIHLAGRVAGDQCRARVRWEQRRPRLLRQPGATRVRAGYGRGGIGERRRPDGDVRASHQHTYADRYGYAFADAGPNEYARRPDGDEYTRATHPYADSNRYAFADTGSN